MRAGIKLFTLAALLLAAFGQMAFSGEHAMAKLEVRLETPAITIYPAGDTSFLTFSEDGILALRGQNDGEVLDEIRLEGRPVSVSDWISRRGIRQLAFVLETGRNITGQVSHGLQILSTDGKRFQRGENANDPMMPVIPLDMFTKPGVMHSFESIEGSALTNSIVVLWDRIGDLDDYLYLVFANSELIERKTSVYPSDLVAFGLENQLLAIHGYASEASFFDIKFGEANGSIFEEALATRQQSRLDRGPPFVTFAPSAATGGSGSAVVVNTDTGELTILEVVPFSRTARFSRPVVAQLPENLATLDDPHSLKLVGDEDLTRIYLSVTGSEDPAMVWGFERLPGGLLPLDPIQLPFTIRDLKRFETESAEGPGLYGILTGDGRTVFFVSDIVGVFSDLPSDDPIVEASVIVPQQTVGAGVLSVQRTLASLGYNVGTIDGISGPITKSAIRSFQLDNALDVTGEVDEITAAVLEESVESARLGLWHVLIASHTPDERGCRFAVDDVSEFAELLKGRVDGGTEVYIVRTSSPTVYAVAISTGDDRAKAEKLSTVVRQVSHLSADGRTGADSFITSNKGWQEDNACRARASVQ